MSAPDCVTVAVRCRPMSAREQNQHEAPIVSITKGGGAESQAVCSLTAPESGAPPREFSFDFAYDGTSDQVTLYDDLGAPLLEKAFCGWNGTIFAYGQTGSGKSFSMTGSAEDPGIIPRMNTGMFDRIAAMAADDPNISVLVTCSFMEIYNEVLRDLLDPAGTRGATAPKSKLGAEGKIEIKEHPTLGVYAQGLREIGVSSHAEIHALMLRGNEMRATASTLMNASSSRSHSIFTIKVRVRVGVRVRFRVRVSPSPSLALTPTGGARTSVRRTATPGHTSREACNRARLARVRVRVRARARARVRVRVRLRVKSAVARAWARLLDATEGAHTALARTQRESQLVRVRARVRVRLGLRFP